MLLANYDPSTHRGIARAANDFGWFLNNSLLNSFQLPSRWKGNGIICSLNNNRTLEQFVIESGLPCVDLSEWRTDLDLPRVSADNQQIGRLAVEHFSTFGHRSFGWFCHQQNPVAQARFLSFQNEIAKRGFPPPSRCVGKQTQNSDSVENWLASLQRPCALFAYNDNDAAWLQSICIEAGYRVPHDFAILGVDNNPLICEHQPVSLSSINHDHERIGYEGAQLLNRIITGEAPPNKIQYIKPNGVTLRASSDMLAASDSLVQQAMAFLIENLRKPISTDDVASNLGISRRNLEMRFQKAINTTVHKKLVELRLKKAESLLCSSDQSIEDIAALTGFCHAPHLCRVFKKEYELPPLAYRKMQQSKRATE